MDIDIAAVVAGKVGFASHQNAVPVLRELELVAAAGGTGETRGDRSPGDRSPEDQPADDRPLEGLTLELTADPPFLEPRTWRIDRLDPGTTLHVRDRDLTLSAGYLAALTESLTGSVTLRASQGGRQLAARSFPVEVLARNHWGGARSMPELLAAFAMPNDPAVDRILKAASDVLRRAGRPDGIDGYEAGTRTRVWELASAIWSAVAGLGLSYALPPASFEQEGQKIRTPGAILDGRVATCLDTALLFAAALEQAQLNPLLVVTQGHAFVGVWLQPQEFAQLLTDEAEAVRKRVELKELVVFETTLATRPHPPGFSQAIAAAERQIEPARDETFVCAVDIRRARMQRIRPLALGADDPRAPGDGGAAPVGEALEAAPVLPVFDVEMPAEAATPAEKLALWQRKLLDLTTRNRLLHLPESAKCIPLLCPEPAVLEDRLASGKRIRIAPMPDLEAGGRDAALYREQTSGNLHAEYARATLERGEVLSTFAKPKLEAELVELYRKARSDLNEGGANTLYLALGFLRWKKAASDPRTYRAPLILLPVKLERRSVLSGVTMVAHEDEPRFNLTLLELLRQDFELAIPGLDGTLPTDEHGVDVEAVWTTVRRAVRDVPGFEVVGDLVLGTFSFAKYLMWKDLADRADQLKQNAVVRHLLDRPVDGFAAAGDFPRASDLDATVDPAALFAPLPADSSQLAAVVASAQGCDFVLDGPPGTGKSQTIANMIAHNLALGRRVLFVAEKMAALDVVHRRLTEKGLGPYCLELHSNKTSKTDVLKQLERAWDARDAMSEEDWRTEAERVRRLRDRLNEIVALLHRRWANGMTLHRAIGRVVRDGGPQVPRMAWGPSLLHDADAVEQMREAARRLDVNRDAVRGVPAGFALLRHMDWSNGWQDEMTAAAAAFPPAADALEAARDALVAALGIPVAAENEPAIERLHGFARLLLAGYGADLRIAFAPDFPAKATAARAAADLLGRYRRAEAELSVRYAAEAVRRIALAQIETAWAEADARFWFLADMARRKVAQRLAAEGGTTGVPDPARDLGTLRDMAALAERVDAATATLAGVPGWAGLASDAETMIRTVDLAERLRAAMAELAPGRERLDEMRRTTEALAVAANELLAPSGPVGAAAGRLGEALIPYRGARERLAALGAIAAEHHGAIAALRATARDVGAGQPRLKAWCDWIRVRTEAAGTGLGPLVDLAEADAVPGGNSAELFETAFSRWFAAAAIDAEPVLRSFVSAQHMTDIEEFRQLDERLADLTVRYIRARLSGAIPDKRAPAPHVGYTILKRELQKQRNHMPLRRLASEMGDAMTKLAPCMLMSPLSIAQYLPPDQALFDLVIFDEASQIAPWDAVGSIARGRQVVIAGDPRQMPPTSFFNRAASAAEDDVEEDLESILDECLAAGIPRHSLSWHYRSRHESLIAFSNHRYYEGGLITFPAAVTRESAVEWRHVPGTYAKGRERTNQAEAEAMVAEAVARLTDPAFVDAGRTLAIVTLNAEQQKLVEDLLDRARRERPEIEPFFGEDRPEPVVVKNLETVQGDERDLIMLGIGYGPTEPQSRAMSMNFGPLNREGGWRRLNVAVTRARREMIVFSSFDAGMIDLNRTGAAAVRDLKHFLEFAERGPRALAEAVQGSVGRHESPFEEAVARALAEKGWTAVPQIGVSRFRIDIGIVHPDRPGDYLVGIECDGATYHGAATARDRDKVRAAILEGLGWRLLRVWSTDWWVDREGSLQRLHGQIEAALEASRREAREAAERAAARDEAAALENAEAQPASATEEAPEDAAPMLARRISEDAPRSAAPYRIADLAAFSGELDPERFHEPAYDATLSMLIAHVLQAEAPVSETVLVQRVARAHGFQRSGRLIRERVLSLTEAAHHIAEDPAGGRFAWTDAAMAASWKGARPAADIDPARPIEEVASVELRAAAAHLGTDDPVAIARYFGVRRVSEAARQRIASALTVLPEAVAD